MTTAPVLDASELAQLGEDLGDLEALHRFVDRYATMLPERVARLDHALAAHDLDDWQDAALSLRTSSAMAGARALSRMVGEAEQTLVPRTPPAQPWPCSDASDDFICALRRLAAETERQLRTYLEHPAPGR